MVRFFSPGDEREENLKGIEKLVDKDSWIGNGDSGELAMEESSEELEALLKYGFLSRKNIESQDIIEKGIKGNIENEYRNVAIEDPVAARIFRDSFPIDFRDEPILEAIDYHLRGSDEQDIQRAFATLNETEPELKASKIDEETRKKLNLREGETAVDELGREIYQSLNGVARHFFEISRRKEGEDYPGFHNSWENHATPTKNEDNEPIKRIEEEFENKRSQTYMPEDEDEIYEKLMEGRDIEDYLNAEGWIEAVELAYRFDLDEKRKVRSEFEKVLEEYWEASERLENQFESDEEILTRNMEITDRYKSFNHKKDDLKSALEDLNQDIRSNIQKAEDYLARQNQRMESYERRLEKLDRNLELMKENGEIWGPNSNLTVSVPFRRE